MARREWAEREAEKLCRKHKYFSEPAIALAFQQAHARAVRVVKARDKWLLDGGYDNMGPDFQAGYHQACNDLLAALTKGRA